MASIVVELLHFCYTDGDHISQCAAAWSARCATGRNGLPAAEPSLGGMVKRDGAMNLLLCEPPKEDLDSLSDQCNLRDDRSSGPKNLEKKPE
jgi:hypothetical protein